MKARITEQQKQILGRILQDRNHQGCTKIAHLESLDPDELEEMQEFVAGEMLENHIEDGELTSEGRNLDDLIGQLAFLIASKRA